MPRGSISPAAQAQIKAQQAQKIADRKASQELGGDVTVKDTPNGKTYKPDYGTAVAKGIGKSVSDVVGIPMRIAKKVTEPEKPSLTSRMNRIIGGVAAGGTMGAMKKLKK